MLVQSLSLLGLSAGLALTWVGIAVLLAFALALAAATLSTQPGRRGPPPRDPPSCITTLAGSIEEIRTGLPAGDHRSWSEPGLAQTVLRRGSQLDAK